ncbi:uncharacterized protein BDZ99DRAFT_496779 [Mytilinidion resinicola]|uniref:Uncharacterized protein n=1 Tax=Mytilinidion resinicola TaxID=574789 RepID=A0A6A6YUY7_9PEZI|nr:uncharacterized protein BDZ99DRAFT_496779 [Mytilinidion resinicola]KAF2812339.1 hypothetical protein BDZ99DRAFT_496779 [Mytilinidion resinicola]
MSTRPNSCASSIPRIRRGPQRSTYAALTHVNLSHMRPQVTALSEPGTESPDSGSFPESSVCPEESRVATIGGSDIASLSEEASQASLPRPSSATSGRDVHSSPGKHQFGFSGFAATRPSPAPAPHPSTGSLVQATREPFRRMMAQRARTDPELMSAMQAVAAGVATPQQSIFVQSRISESFDNLRRQNHALAPRLAASSPGAHFPEDLTQSSPFDGLPGGQPPTSRVRSRRSDSHLVGPTSVRGGSRMLQDIGPHPMMHLSGRFVEDTEHGTYYTFHETIKLPPTYTREDMRRACDLAFPHESAVRNRGPSQTSSCDHRTGAPSHSEPRGTPRRVSSLARAQYDGISAFPRSLYNESRRPVGPARRSSHSTPNLLAAASISALPPSSPPPSSPSLQGRPYITGSNQLVTPSDFDESYRNPVNAARLDLSSPLDLIQSRGHAHMHNSSSSTSIYYYTASSQPRVSITSPGLPGQLHSPRSFLVSPPRNPTPLPTRTGSRRSTKRSTFGSLRRSRIPSPLPFTTGTTYNPSLAARSRSHNRSSGGGGGALPPPTRRVPRPLPTPRRRRNASPFDSSNDQQLRAPALIRTQARSSENAESASSPRIATRNQSGNGPNLQTLPIPEVFINNRQVPAGPRIPPNASNPLRPIYSSSPRVSSGQHGSLMQARSPRAPRSSENESYAGPLAPPIHAARSPHAPRSSENESYVPPPPIYAARSPRASHSSENESDIPPPPPIHAARSPQALRSSENESYISPRPPQPVPTPRSARAPRSPENESHIAPTGETFALPLPLPTPVPPPRPAHSATHMHSSRLPTPGAQPSQSYHPHRRRNAVSNGSDERERPRASAVSQPTSGNANATALAIRTRGPRLPAWQHEQENSGEAEEALMMAEIRVRGAREGSGGLDVLDETPPRLGRFERRMMGL